MTKSSAVSTPVSSLSTLPRKPSSVLSLSTLRHYEPIFVEIALFERGWVTFNENFRGKGASPTNEFWHQKTRVPGLSYGEKNAENFNRLSRAHQRHRQTDDRRQTELRRQLANVNASSRPLKQNMLIIIEQICEKFIFHVLHELSHGLVALPI